MHVNLLLNWSFVNESTSNFFLNDYYQTGVKETRLLAVRFTKHLTNSSLSTSKPSCQQVKNIFLAWHSSPAQRRRQSHSTSRSPTLLLLLQIICMGSGHMSENALHINRYSIVVMSVVVKYWLFSCWTFLVLLHSKNPAFSIQQRFWSITVLPQHLAVVACDYWLASAQQACAVPRLMECNVRSRNPSGARE